MNSFWIILLIVLLVCFLASCVFLAYIWIRRKRFTKERFAFASLTAIITLTLALIGAIAGQTMPWDLVRLAISWAQSEPIELSKPDYPEYALLVLVYFVAIWAIRGLFRDWDGQRSERQHAIEERQESMSLVLEGIQELTRLLKRGPDPTLHQRTSQYLVTQLQEPSDSKAWRDRARELLRLKHSCYHFDPHQDWHS